MQIVRLKPGATALEVWTADPALGPKGSVLDGIAVLGDRVFVNTLRTHKLFAVPIGKDGKAGAVADIELSRPLQQPDGMRAIGSSRLLLGENFAQGHVLLVDVEGNRAKLTPVGDALAKGAVAVTLVGKDIWALDPTVNAEGSRRRHRAVHFPLP
jgi:hypothetical protein